MILARLDYVPGRPPRRNTVETGHAKMDAVLDERKSVGKLGCDVPLYEYRCNTCKEISSVLVYSWSETQEPDCGHCGSSDVQRLISKLSFRPSWGRSLNWAPSAETTSDIDEDSPASIDAYMGRIKKEMGGQTTPEFERERREIKDS